LANPNAVAEPRKHRTRNRWLLALAAVAGVLLVAFALTAEYIARHAGPLLRSSVVATLSSRFQSPVELDALDVSVTNGLQVQGRGLRIFYLAGPTQPDLKQKQGLAAPPMLSVNSFTFHTAFHDLLYLRANLARVDVDGMELHIPPHSGTRVLHFKAPTPHIAITVATIYCKNVKLVIETATPDKAPLIFIIPNLELTGIAPGHPMLYVADVVNPRPTGDIHASGHFGPWHSDDPRSTPLDGDYSFTHADLGTIKGIAGTLSSTGHFAGLLSHLTVDGTTTTPNFSLDTSNHPVPLETTFHALVDATTGDTTLAPVTAALLHSPFTAQGTIANIHGRGHDIVLTIDMPHGRIEDLLQLGMKTDPPLMRGAVALHAKLHIPPGPTRVTQKLQLAGTVHIQNVAFTSAKLQGQINSLSLRAQGNPAAAKSAATESAANSPATPQPNAASDMAITFSLANATLLVPSLAYQIPGAKVQLTGAYIFDSTAFEFLGHVHTTATASQMVTGWKSALLKPFDSMFKKNGAGTELPLNITGSHGNFNIGFAMHGSDETPEQIAASLRAIH
jgi:hypothetical protein